MSSTVQRSNSAQMDSPFSQHSNTAGAPLPFIPRRAHHTQNSLQKVFPTFQEEDAPTRSAPVPMVAEPATSQSQSSGSSDVPLELDTERKKRLRNRIPVFQGTESSPTVRRPYHSTTSRVVTAPITTSHTVPSPSTTEIQSSRLGKGGNLRLNFGNLTPLTPSSGFTLSPDEPRIRKKSGEPLKSSLKTPLPRTDLAIFTSGAFISSKSEPTTPTHSRSKSVQFAEQLERVKLFLAEQKPLAVSRDGSPTDDTSGTESDFPSFIYGTADEDKKKNLVMRVVNMPKRSSLSTLLVDVMLQDVSLSQDATILGHLRVRNLAFQKWLAVRFTFDLWQTTSEVTAKYEKSLDAEFDQFSFSIRIHDMLSRIEEKTLFMAIRYTVNGRDIWDNNSGKNYEMKFTVRKPQRKLPRSTDDLSDPGSPGITDLKNKLEEVAKGNTEPIGTFLTNRARRVTHQGTVTSPTKSDMFNFSSATPLSSRYDFSASLKSDWKPAESPVRLSHTRTNTYPSSAGPWPQQRALPAGKSKKPYTSQNTRGSPRIDDDYDTPPAPPLIQDQDVDVVDDEQISVSTPRRRGDRNHHRGYFEAGLSHISAVKMTPPGSPVDMTRNRLFPPLTSSNTVKDRLDDLLPPLSRESSTESTPSMTEESESDATISPSHSNTPSPEPRILDLNEPVKSDMSVFLNRFCFYTGSDSSLNVPVDMVPRSHSASSVEELLYSTTPPSSSPVLHRYRPTMSNRPSISSFKTRSSSCDDVGTLSGASTPTPTSTPLVKAF